MQNNPKLVGKNVSILIKTRRKIQAILITPSKCVKKNIFACKLPKVKKFT